MSQGNGIVPSPLRMLSTNAVAPDPDDDVPFERGHVCHQIHAEVAELLVFLVLPLDRDGEDPNVVFMVRRKEDHDSPHQSLEFTRDEWVDLVRAVRQIDVTGRAAGLLPEPPTYKEWLRRFGTAAAERVAALSSAVPAPTADCEDHEDHEDHEDRESPRAFAGRL